MRGPQDFSIRSQRVLLPAGETAASVKVEAGIIVAVEDHGAWPGGEHARDVGDLVLMPGLVDTHVHLNEPGRADWEGFATGTAAAAAGGVTTVIDMPLNSSPVTTTAEALSRKRQAAAGKLSIDVGFYGGLIPGNAHRMNELIDAGVIGVKAFLCHSGIDEFPPATEKELRKAMPVLAERGVPLLVHAELVHDRPPPEGDPRRYDVYLASRPPSFERDAVAMMIDLCAATGCRTHIVHLADAGCLSMLLAAKERGLPITAETCPQYLAFAAEDIADGRTEFKCAPPIREAAHREKLWDALAAGLIDMIVSDHSPCPPEMKALDSGRFDRAWGGISSLQLGLSVVWTEARRRGHPLTDVVRWMGTHPAALVGLPHGGVVGHPAHLAVFDPDTEWVVDGSTLEHRHPVTPYHGRELRGVVRQTFVHGQPASPGVGRPL
ncbi:MAG: allantoinase AllB [Planctomycetota bacterium]